MKMIFQGDQGQAICEHCGPVDTTYCYRDVPLSGSGKMVKKILVAVCKPCGRVAAIPAQSTPAIQVARDKTIKSIEAVLPAPYMEALDMAAFKVSSSATTEMRKYLVRIYLHKHLETPTPPSDWMVFEREFKNVGILPNKRFSIKVSSKMENEFMAVKTMFNMSKTDTLKTIIHEIKEDILDHGLVRPEMAWVAKIAWA